MAETNVELARRAFEGVLRGDLDLVKGLLDRDVKWHGGDPEAPGACRGRMQALAFIDRARERVRDVEVLDVVGAGEKVVVIMGARAVDGEPAWTAANVSTFRNGKVIEMCTTPTPRTRSQRPARARGPDPRRANATVPSGTRTTTRPTGG